MGSLKQVDPDVTGALKAVLLQHTLVVHLLTSLHPCLWALGKGGNCFTCMSLLGMGKEADLGLGLWAGGHPPALHGHPLLQQLPHQVCQGDGPWRAVWGLPGGTGAYQKMLGLFQDPQECWLFWLSSPLVPPPLQGTELHEHSQTACGPVGKVLCSEKDRNKPAKCWISFSSAGKRSRDSRGSCSSDKTRVPCEGKEGGEGSLAELTQPTQEHLQK